MLYYFLVPGYYNRAELSIRKNNYLVSPDYVGSFRQRAFSTYTQVAEKIYMSKTPDPTRIFLIWLRLDQDEEFNDVVFITSVDTVSMWGALWGVLFALLAFYFLRYNRRRFYEEKPDWGQFDEEFERIKRKKAKNGEFQEHEEEKTGLMVPVDEQERKIL